jgi:hypothetical protein
MELRNETGHDLVVQVLCVWEGEVLEAVSEVNTPLAHNVVGSDFLCLEVVGGASDNYIVGVRIPVHKFQL